MCILTYMRGTTDNGSILAHANVVNISTASVIEHEGKILIIEESVDGKAVYNFPSGKAHLDELIEQAALREATEETGYAIKLTDVVGVYYYRTKKNSNDRKKDRITVRFNFWATLASAEPIQKHTRDVLALHWLTHEELKKLLAEKKLRNWVAEQLAQDVLADKRVGLSAVQQFRG